MKTPKIESYLSYQSTFDSLHKSLTMLFRGFQESELSELLEKHEQAELTNDFLILLELVNKQFSVSKHRKV